MFRNLCAAAVGLTLCLPAAVRAEDDIEQMPVATDEVDPLLPAPKPEVERPFVFATDPTLPEPGHVLVTAGVGNVTQTGEQRALGAGTLTPLAGAELGILPRLSAFAQGSAAFTNSPSEQGQRAFEVGAHVLLTAPESKGIRVALQASAGRDFSAAPVARLGATAAWEGRGLRLAASLTASRDFSASVDGMDLSGVLAAAYALPAGLRMGAELVAQDLEEAGADGAEHGMSAFAGPTLGWQLGRRFQVVAGPAISCAGSYRGVLARGAMTVSF